VRKGGLHSGRSESRIGKLGSNSSTDNRLATRSKCKGGVPFYTQAHTEEDGMGRRVVAHAIRAWRACAAHARAQQGAMTMGVA
jgi:hypothetical protein